MDYSNCDPPHPSPLCYHNRTYICTHSNIFIQSAVSLYVVYDAGGTTFTHTHIHRETHTHTPTHTHTYTQTHRQRDTHTHTHTHTHISRQGLWYLRILTHS